VKKQQQEEVDLLWIKLLYTNYLSFNINLETKIAINPWEAPIFCVHSNGMCARQVDSGVAGLCEEMFARKLGKLQLDKN